MSKGQPTYHQLTARVRTREDMTWGLQSQTWLNLLDLSVSVLSDVFCNNLK